MRTTRIMREVSDRSRIPSPQSGALCINGRLESLLKDLPFAIVRCCNTSFEAYAAESRVLGPAGVPGGTRGGY